MQIKPIPYFTLVLSLVTLLYSFYVAHDISGSFFGKVSILQLEKYGGIRLQHLLDFELWRLFASQIIHVKQFHMLFNVLSFFVLGLFLERYIGFTRMFFLWFVSGAAGTLLSTLYVSAPWNLGTGASQAIMGIAAFGVLIWYRKVDTSRGLKCALGFAIIPALSLDFIFAHYPKPGHVLGFSIGFLIGMYYLNIIVISSKQDVNSNEN